MSRWIGGRFDRIELRPSYATAYVRGSLRLCAEQDSAFMEQLRFVPCNRALKTRHKQMFLNRDG
jgi:hypothetical protein